MKTAAKAGAQIVGTTLSGYTGDPIAKDEAPDIALVKSFRSLPQFVMAEGRYNTPALAADTMIAGADAVTIGSALTRLEHVTTWFNDAIQGALRS